MPTYFDCHTCELRFPLPSATWMAASQYWAHSVNSLRRTKVLLGVVWAFPTWHQTLGILIVAGTNNLVSNNRLLVCSERKSQTFFLPSVSISESLLRITSAPSPANFLPRKGRAHPFRKKKGDVQRIQAPDPSQRECCKFSSAFLKTFFR